MTDSYKFIVAKNGYAYNNNDIRNIVFHSDYKLLKQYIEATGSLTFSAGETYKSVSLAHNLGYVPAYLPFIHWPDFTSGVTQYHLTPVYASGFMGDIAIVSYSDSSNIVFNAEVYDVFTNYYPILFDYTDNYSNNGNYNLCFGKEGGDGRDCAIRFYNIDLNKNQSITSATIEYWISEKGSSTSDAKLQCWGIDEDDCGEIWQNLGRDKTSARTTQNVAAGANSFFGINVTNQVREIIARNGWQNGNHMGFYIFDDGSPNNTHRRDSNYNTYLKIVLPGSHTMYFKALVFLDKIL